MALSMPAAFFVVRDGGFEATPLTRGPWADEHQHGGPPCALLAGAVERFGADNLSYFVSRLTFDYLKPVPIGRCEVSVEPIKLGNKVQRLLGRLVVDGDEVLRVQALRLLRRTVALERPVDAPWPEPAALESFTFPFFKNPVGYQAAMEVKYARGRFGDTDCDVWMRAKVPLVEGRETSGLERVVTAVDAESGVCTPLDVERYTFINPDLSVALDRPLEGEWVGLQAKSSASADGVGLAQAGLRDQRGFIGRSMQTLVVQAR